MIGRFLQVDAASNVNETLCAIWYHFYNLKHSWRSVTFSKIDLVPFVQFKKREKHSWKSVTFSSLQLLHGYFSRFLKLYKWYRIAQSIKNGFLDVNRSSKQYKYQRYI